MSDGLLAALLLVAFLAATILGEVLPRRVAWIPIVLLALACGAGFLELARYDHGHADLLTWVGFVGAPIAAILGGAAWGTRRFYGWPDLGPHPSRLGLVSAAILLGVLVGSRVRENDIEESKSRAEAMRRQRVVELHGLSHDPDSLSGAAAVRIGSVRTRMGLLDPPPFWSVEDTRRGDLIVFPVSERHALALDKEGRWDRVERGKAGIP